MPASPALALAMPQPSLLERLAALQHYDSVLSNGFSNHLPMALAALSALGASEARMDALEQHLRPGLRPAQPEFAESCAGYRAALQARGRDAVLHEALPVAMAAPATAWSFPGRTESKPADSAASGTTLLTSCRPSWKQPAFPGRKS